MKTILKRIVIQMYCRDLISATTAARVFARFNLWKA
jgi:hypothetical protein